MIATKENIAKLRQSIEEAMGRTLLAPKDFDLLSERIFARVGEMVSRNTLKRIWGIMDEGREPRLSTLSILARFVGYADFSAFVNNASKPDDVEDSSTPLWDADSASSTD